MALGFSFLSDNILQDVADAIRYCEDSKSGIAPKDYAKRIKALDDLLPQPDALNFYAPNGCTIAFNKTGSPTTVGLEYSVDRGQNWVTWQPNANGNRTITLSAGQRMYLRNTSETSTGLCVSDSAYYTFTFSDEIYAKGKLDSMLCKNPDNATFTSFCYDRLFRNCTYLKTAPTLSNKTATWVYRSCFQNTGIESITIPVTKPSNSQFYYAMYNCANLKEIRTSMTNVTASDCLFRWVYNVPEGGDFYCKSSLSINTGVSGIPTGWTRHDI